MCEIIPRKICENEKITDIINREWRNSSGDAMLKILCYTDVYRVGSSFLKHLWFGWNKSSTHREGCENIPAQHAVFHPLLMSDSLSFPSHCSPLTSPGIYILVEWFGFHLFIAFVDTYCQCIQSLIFPIPLHQILSVFHISFPPSER